MKSGKPYIRKSTQSRKDEILAAATNVFLKKGYHAATMEDIIAETTLSKGGFYHYYKSTRDIMIDLIRRKNQTALQKSKALPECKTKADLCHTLATIFVERMFQDPQNQKLHLMMASELTTNPKFIELYMQQERETLSFLKDLIKKVVPDFDTEHENPQLLLLYRINNTLHFVENLYDSKETFGLDQDVLYNFYYKMLQDIIDA